MTLVIDYTYQNLNNFVSLVHQFKISKSHFHKISGNRLHEPDNRLPIQKEIFWTDFILNKRILSVKILRPNYSNQIEILLTNLPSLYLRFSWSCSLTWFNLCSSSKLLASSKPAWYTFTFEFEFMVVGVCYNFKV